MIGRNSAHQTKKIEEHRHSFNASRIRTTRERIHNGQSQVLWLFLITMAVAFVLLVRKDFRQAADARMPASLQIQQPAPQEAAAVSPENLGTRSSLSLPN